LSFNTSKDEAASSPASGLVIIYSSGIGATTTFERTFPSVGSTTISSFVGVIVFSSRTI